MNNILTRDCIVDGLVLTEIDNTFNVKRVIHRDEFCTMIDRWKILLLEKYDAKPGQSFFVHGHPGATYYSVMFAAWELGLINILDLPRCNTKEDLTSTKTKMFGTIDFIIRTNIHSEIFGPDVVGKYDPDRWYAGPTFKWEYERARTQSRNIIELEEFETYVVKNPSKYVDVANVILCTPDSSLIKFPSSGTTSAPRVIYDSHKKMMALGNRCTTYLKLTSEEQVVHQNNLNHGSTFVVHWLPTFIICKYHFTASPANFEGLVQWCNHTKINRLMLYTTKLLTDWITTSAPVEHTVKIQTLYQITPEIIELVKEKNINTVFGNFGSSEIGGPFFVKHITPNVNINAYEIAKMGTPIDDFWQFEVRDGLLWIKSDAIGLKWTTANDKFEKRGNDFYFLGRDNLYRIGEEWFDLDLLEKKLTDFFKDTANIVVDADLQKLYLSIWQDTPGALDQFNEYLKTSFSNIQIDYIMRDESVDAFSNGRKLDQSLIRDYCRNKLGISKIECN